MNELRIRTIWIAPPGPVAEGLRIGLLGGSFNPPHEGHVHASEAALKRLQLDFVWWLVSPQNPLKPERGMESFANRLEAARDFTRNPKIVVSGIEAELGTQFTIDTLKALQHRFPQLRFVWLMGSDNLLQIPRWRSWQEIFRLIPVAVVTRPKSALQARFSKAATRFKGDFRPADRHLAVTRPPAWTVIEGRRNPSSASELRAASRSRA